MARSDRPLVWLHGERLSLPHSRPMPVIGPRCHELRVVDGTMSWRLVYRLDTDAVIVVAVFAKSTQATPLPVIRTCRERLKRYDAAVAAGE